MNEHEEQARSVGSLVPRGRGGVDEPDMSRLAEELVASASEAGLQLTGEGGLLTALTRQVLQSALEVEMTHHLGYDRHDPAGRVPRTTAMGPRRRRSVPTLGKSLSRSPGIGRGPSSRRSCGSINEGWRASIRR
jgi:hypothetical protein